jgi:hypothetical protein
VKRREFIALLGGAAAAWPLVAQGQPAKPSIGFLHSASADTFRSQLDAFRQGLRDGGYVEGENIAIPLGGRSVRSPARNGGRSRPPKRIGDRCVGRQQLEEFQL